MEELEAEWKGPGLGSIVRGCVRGVEEAVKDASEHAKAKHPWQNRTWNLERSIGGRIASQGMTTAGGEVEGEFVATEDYASFLEDGTSRAKPYPFIAPALTKAESIMMREIEAGEDAAASVMNRGR